MMKMLWNFMFGSPIYPRTFHCFNKPESPNDGDFWIKGTHLFQRRNGKWVGVDPSRYGIDLYD